MNIFVLKLTDKKAIRQAVFSAIAEKAVRLTGAVVVAEDETAARKLCASHESKVMEANDEEGEFYAPWYDPRLSSCEKLGTAEGRTPGIVLQDSLTG